MVDSREENDLRRYDYLLKWLKSHGMQLDDEHFHVQRKRRPGAGNGLYTTTALPMVKMLPVSLEAATERMMRPESIAREVLGNDFVDHFGGTRRHEVQLWNQAVTSWEVERYLELI